VTGALKTQYEFTLPRGYLDAGGRVHRTGVMRLATARDELEPLRDPTVTGPDDPRLTVLILARVVQTLGDLQMVTAHEIEGLFAADLAFLQDFYGVINFGNQAEYEALLSAQAESAPLTGAGPAPVARSAQGAGSPVGPGADGPTGPDGPDNGGPSDFAAFGNAARPRARVEEIPRGQA
jgi:hypothetical protein